MQVLDVGCGVGGPAREIARFSGAHVTGLNNNAYQIERGEKYNVRHGVGHLCDYVKADFMKMPIRDNTYDAVYSIEATCHAPDRVGVFSEIKRVLKPGGLFASYEWCMTDLYNPENPIHKIAKRNIEIGDSLPNLEQTTSVLESVKKAGFEVVEERDVAIPDSVNPVPWWVPLAPSFSVNGFRVTSLGKLCTHYLTVCLEKIGVAPKGAVETHEILLKAADGLKVGGQLGIFTPMYFFVARKPLQE